MALQDLAAQRRAERQAAAPTPTGTTRAPASTPVNPRSSGGQATAARPTGTSAPGTTSSNSVDYSQTRINQRAAENINMSQIQQHAQAGLNQTVDTERANEIRSKIAQETNPDILQGLQNELKIVESGTYGFTTTEGGKRALAEMQGRAEGKGLNNVNIDDLNPQDRAAYDSAIQRLASTEAGAMGKAGALGFNTEGLSMTTEGFNPVTQKLKDEIKGLQDITPGSIAGIADPSYYADINAKRAEQRASLTEQLRVQEERDRATKEEQRKASATPGSTYQSNITNNAGKNLNNSVTTAMAQTSSVVESLKSAVAANPELAPSLLPQISMLESQLNGVEYAKNEALAGIGDGSQLVASVAESKELLAKEKDETDRLLKENRDIQLDAASINRDIAQLEKNKFDIQQAQRESEARENLIDQEMQNRRASAKLGINFDTGGLEFMQKELRRGRESLAFMEQFGDAQSSQLAIAATRQYQNDVSGILNDFESKNNDNDSKFASDLSAMDTVIAEDEKERQKMRQDIIDKAMDRRLDIEKAAGVAIQTAVKDLSTQKAEAAKTARENMDKASDFTSSMRKEINTLDVVKEYNKISTQWNALNSAESLWKSGNLNQMGILDQTLITVYNKMLDPTSVVREGEFDRTEQMTSALNYLKGKFGTFMSGGTAITDAERNDIITLAKSYKEVYDEKLYNTLEPYAIDFAYNKNERFSDTNISWDQIVPPSMRTATDSTVSIIDSIASGSAGTYSESGDFTMGESYDTSTPVNISNGSSINTSVVSGIITGIDGSPLWKEGLDVAAPKGSPVKTHQTGYVEKVIYNPSWVGNPASSSADTEKINAGKKQNGGFGNQVVVRYPDGTRAMYSHLSNVTVKEGSTIPAGTQVGAVGNTGSTIGKTGNHLDLTVKKPDGSYYTAREVAAWIGLGVQTATAADYPQESTQQSELVSDIAPGIFTAKTTEDMQKALQEADLEGALNKYTDERSKKMIQDLIHIQKSPNAYLAGKMLGSLLNLSTQAGKYVVKEGVIPTLSGGAEKVSAAATGFLSGLKQ